MTNDTPAADGMRTFIRGHLERRRQQQEDHARRLFGAAPSTDDPADTSNSDETPNGDDAA
ncbi:MAG: hypothetical protein QOH56_2838 [Pseudonocardiales bacterium]|jgi:hypothetical protein|nr:hypothetical protein [Pseudonocardiales bacterium]